MVYHIAFSRVIERPLSKVYAWCTDFEPEDARFEPQRKFIKIISKQFDRVEFEGEDYDGTSFLTRVNSLETSPDGDTKFTFSCDGTYKGKKSSLTQEDVQKELETFWDRLISSLEEEVKP